MRHKGRLRSWHDERGFGFIDPGDGGKEVFLHISALGHRDRRPQPGQVVTYSVSTDKQGRLRAVQATLPGDRLPGRSKHRAKAGAVTLAGVFLAIVAAWVFLGKIPDPVLWGYLGISLITFIVYAFDKRAAREGRWRTRESTLHALAVVGGWPGALVARQTLRHKSSKAGFRAAFWMTVCLNLGAFAWLFTANGMGTLQSWLADGHALVGVGERATIQWAEPRTR